MAHDTSGAYVVRLGRDIPEHGIFQHCVQTAMHSATQAGVTPALRFNDGAITVSDFIDGRHLRPEDMRDEAILAGLVSRIRQLHASGALVSGTLTYFWPFQVVRNYAAYCAARKSSSGLDLDALVKQADRLEKLVAPFKPVFTHNDIVPQNVMLGKDGTVFLIDWDYGAYGHPMFDVAAITANIDVEDEDEVDARVLALYADNLDHEVWKQYRLFKLIINLRELLWGEVQDLMSELDQSIVQAGMASLYPDQQQGYAGYAEMNLKRFDRNLAHFNSLYG